MGTKYPIKRRAQFKEAFAQSVLWGFTIEKEENGIMTIDPTQFSNAGCSRYCGKVRVDKQG